MDSDARTPVLLSEKPHTDTWHRVAEPPLALKTAWEWDWDMDCE